MDQMMGAGLHTRTCGSAILRYHFVSAGEMSKTARLRLGKDLEERRANLSRGLRFLRDEAGEVAA